ncbi:MAG: undecaprenyl diphosphate synthase family protein [Hyphomicrobiales bacterium]|nr:undecaprenyl diphosphate synthase family protein [Hyphomicrobiales bacterium]
MINFVYRLYTRWLLREVGRAPTPGHVAIFLDGNRHHGERMGLTDPTAIYTIGASKLDDVLEWCAELRSPAVTLWVLSTNNLNRPADEVAGILAAIEGKMRALAQDPQIHRRRMRIRAEGKLESLPSSAVAAIRAAREATAGYDGMILTIVTAYGGRAEIIDAARAPLVDDKRNGGTLDDAIAHVTAQAISRRLYMGEMPDPDLSSARAARCGCRASCCGKEPTANSTSPMSTGPHSAKSTSCAPSARINKGSGDLACRRCPVAQLSEAPGDKTPAELAQEFDVRPDRITTSIGRARVERQSPIAIGRKLCRLAHWPAHSWSCR